MIVYFNGRYIPKEQVCISPDDRGFLFGDGTYEVIRVYHGRIFRLSGHMARLKRSLHEIRIDCVDFTELEQAAEMLLQKNPEYAKDGILYFQITRGAAMRHHKFPDTVNPTIYAALSPLHADPGIRKRGVPVILYPDQRWGRCDIKSIALLANVLAAEEARQQNAYEAVFVRDGWITEGTRTNIAAVFNGTVQTHPIGHYILGGITRDAVLALCGKLDIPVLEEPISEKRLMEAEEIFLMGTTTEIGPVARVDQTPVSLCPGPVTKKLQNAFQKLISASRDMT